MSNRFARGAVIYDKALAIVFLLVGMSGLLAAVAGVISAVLDRLDTGTWHIVPFMQIAAFKALAHPTFLQQAVIWVCSTPNFVLNALIGVGLLWMGVRRWIGADFSRNPIS